MHKSVMGLLFAIAWQEGKVDPSAPAATYLPEWQGMPQQAITVEQLLQMSSGLARPAAGAGPFAPSKGLMLGRKTREIVTSLALQTKPGSSFLYNNANSQLAGFVLEAATGQRYVDYLSEKLWQPIGAADAFVWPERPGATPRTYASLLARPLDWLKVGLLIFNGGAVDGKQIITEAALGRALTPSPAAPNYGWQIWLGQAWQHPRYYNDTQEGFGVPASEPFAMPDLVYFDGFGGQRVYVSRSAGFVVVTTGNVNLDLDDSVIPNAVMRALDRYREQHEQAASSQ
jgi:CubicO group peptidase (beta-lactamase class C family)